MRPIVTVVTIRLSFRRTSIRRRSRRPIGIVVVVVVVAIVVVIVVAFEQSC